MRRLLRRAFNVTAAVFRFFQRTSSWKYTIAICAAVVLPYFANRQLWVYFSGPGLLFVLIYIREDRHRIAAEHAARCRRDMICVKCGYDLRATPARCPECGTVPAAGDGGTPIGR